jgi:Ion channel
MRAFASPDSYGLVLLLILVTYALSAALSASWAASLVIAVQIVTVWVALRASRARRSARVLTSCALAASALAAVANLFLRDQIDGGTVASWVSCLLYLIAPMSIVRHLVMRRVVDGQTLVGAIDAYLMAGMFFAFLYHSVSLTQQSPPFFGSQGHGTFPQDLFFSFTTLTTTGYGSLVPAANPGQTLAVLEMVAGQLFLVTAVGKVVSSWRPGQSRRSWDSSSNELGPPIENWHPSPSRKAQPGLASASPARPAGVISFGAPPLPADVAHWPGQVGWGWCRRVARLGPDTDQRIARVTPIRGQSEVWGDIFAPNMQAQR